MNWTFDMNESTIDDTIHALALARVEASIAHPRAEGLLAQAERIVTAGQVMIVESAAWVYDQDDGWKQVTNSYCGHLCIDDPCVHQLAAWLARHLAQAKANGYHQPAAESCPAPSGCLGGIGPGYHSGNRSRPGGRKRSTCQDCNRCHFYRNGSCYNPNKRVGRGR